MLAPLAVGLGNIDPVIGFDIDAGRIEELRTGFDRTKEVDETEMESAAFLRLTNDELALSDASVYIIAVPTPIDDANQPDLSLLKKAAELIVVTSKLMILWSLSPVFPGATEDVCPIRGVLRFGGLLIRSWNTRWILFGVFAGAY